MGGVVHVLQALKSLSCSDPRVTNRAGSCLASFFYPPVFFFSNANAERALKASNWPIQIQRVVFGEAPAHVGVRGLSSGGPPPPPRLLPDLLCAAVIGTDVPLASHRATFP